MHQKRFRDELRQSLLIHSLVPVIIATFVFLICSYIIWLYALTNSMDRDLENYEIFLDDSFSKYSDFLYKIPELDLDLLENDIEAKAEFNRRLYLFLNSQKIKGNFFLTDKNFNLILCSKANASAKKKQCSEIQKVIKSGGLSEDFKHFLWYEKDGEFPSLFIYRKLQGSGGTAGFILQPKNIVETEEINAQHFAISDKFGRIFQTNTPMFFGANGKINPRISSIKGFFLQGNLYYYIKKIYLKNFSFELYIAKGVQEMFSMFSILLAVSGGFIILQALTIWKSSNIIAKKKTKLLEEMVESFKKVSDGYLQERLYIQSPEEFSIISESYNKMLENVQNLIKKNEEQMQQAINLNLRLLEIRFNKHFLFNTLETVRFMTRISPEIAEEIVVRLSNLLRYSIKHGDETVELNEDIGYVKDYFQILSYRFRSRMIFSIDVDDVVGECLVPKLIFQPLVENSIKYGLDEKQSVNIEISVKRKNEDIVITISDNGPGIETEKLRQIMDEIYENTKCTHIGVYSVHRRLVLMYGKPYGISITSTRNEGTKIELLLPFIKKSEKKNDDCTYCRG